MFGVLSAWLVEVGLITYRDLKAGSTNTINGLPLPADYVATFVVFGALGALAEVPAARNFAGITAWGFVLASVLNLVDPTSPLNRAKESQAAGDPAPTTNTQSTSAMPAAA
jgi:hypothetical protein